jgi:uncharacterized membrane protein
MRRTTLLALTTLFSFLGIADAWYLAEHALNNTALSCGVDTGALSGCNIVAQSAYAHLLGIPLGVYGVAFYVIVFLIAAVAYTNDSRKLEWFLLVCGVVGAVASLAFEGIQVFLIKALCIYCLGSFFLSLGIFITTSLLVRQRPQLPSAM